METCVGFRHRLNLLNIMKNIGYITKVCTVHHVRFLTIFLLIEALYKVVGLFPVIVRPNYITSIQIILLCYLWPGSVDAI